MQPAKHDARWGDAILLTIALWTFVMLMFLPVILGRYQTHEWSSVLLDVSTFIPCAVLGLGIFAVFRNTQDWVAHLRTLVLAGSVLAAAVIQTAYDYVFEALITANFTLDVSGLSVTPSYEKVFRYLLVFAVNLALFQLAMTRRTSLRSERRLAEARSAAQQAHLQALRYQINPHFLFNTLNSISALIVTKRNEDAEDMTSKLSNFLRSSLTCDPAGLVPLEEELTLIEEYLDIEAVRFGERLKVEIECNGKAGDVLIPSFLIQPLVENAIKHGVAPSREPVTVSIRAALKNGRLNIRIENDRTSIVERASVGTSVGLANVRQRLAAVYGEAASLAIEKDDGVFCAIISVPASGSVNQSS